MSINRFPKKLSREATELGSSVDPKLRFGVALAAVCLIFASVTIVRADDQHWSFRPLSKPAVPAVKDSSRMRNPVDRFVQSKLEAHGLTIGPQAERAILIRRVAFDLTGLPPTPTEIAEFVVDPAPDAFEHMVERFLASASYGERWGKWWLEVAGYADSNGYFNADSDRPLAYRYRDYVIRSFNADKPFDEFVREQIAGDELSGFDPQQHARAATLRMIERLEATHFLRNGPDGSGESDGNPEEVLIDRYTALEGSQQIVMSSLLGLTIQCCKCHDHKFEPISQREFYQLQSHLYPIFNLKKWLKPNERFAHASLPGEMELWETQQHESEAHVATLRSEFGRWVREHRPKAGILFEDDFGGPESSFAEKWSNTAPGDDAPGGTTAVALATAADSKPEPPAAVRADGTLRLIEGGASGDKWLSTKQAFDWTPNRPGDWIQVTFDLLADRVVPAEQPAARIAFFLATRDFNDNGDEAFNGGNVLFDGNPAGGAVVIHDYPGTDQTSRGTIGKSGYKPGQNYGVRVTNIDGKKYRLEQIVDWLPEERPLDLTADELPDGGFGFEFCCGRSFIVDNVVIEQSSSSDTAGNSPSEQVSAEMKVFRDGYETRRKTLESAVTEANKLQTARPGKIAWAVDISAEPPEVPLLVRGNVMTPGELVQPMTLRVLTDVAEPPATDNAQHEPATALREATTALRSTGRRTALANWLTRPDSRAAALMARVQANRIWQRHFGRGLVPTTDNLGVSGAKPSHRELLEWLALELMGSVGERESGRNTNDGRASVAPSPLLPIISDNWSLKRLHRVILNSATYRQSSQLHDAAFAADPDNRLLWRANVRRLDAESLRDAMLFASGDLERRLFGPYIPTSRSSAAEVVVAANQPGANRRSIYLQQRRTQTLSLLNLFDTPTLTINCVQRPTTTMPLQSLSLLNSDFATIRAAALSRRLEAEQLRDPRLRVRRLFEIVTGALPRDDELRSSLSFVEEQTRAYEPHEQAAHRAWADLCQMLLASNGFLYVE